MLIPPRYFLTTRITQLLQSIEVSREVIEAITIAPEVELNLRRQSTLKSSLFSARIEGNPLTLDEVTRNPSRDQKRREVYNILKALNWIRERKPRDLSKKNVLLLHELVLKNLVEKQELGKFRREMSAIFNKAGIAVYMSPAPRSIDDLLNKLIKFINSDKVPLVPIRAALAHYAFEKIHPFLDGNGRVGRLVFQAVLAKGGYGMKGIVPIEEYLDTHRSAYYKTLEATEKDVTDYVEFMLEALEQTAAEAKKLVLGKQKYSIEDTLLPRRAEILVIIKDHKLINFDTIKRRFLKVNGRTLRYDIKKLVDAGLVCKRGTTRGVYYEPMERD